MARNIEGRRNKKKSKFKEKKKHPYKIGGKFRLRKLDSKKENKN